MTEPVFLKLDEVLEIHAYQIEQHGGDSALLDAGKLESALAQPRQGIDGKYFHEDLAAIAAAYLYHICQNHAFADGNKRTAMHAAIVFLAINGHDDLKFPLDECEALVLGIARGEIGKDEIAGFFRKLIAP